MNMPEPVLRSSGQQQIERAMKLELISILTYYGEEF